jgi:hypothetical protein
MFLKAKISTLSILVAMVMVLGCLIPMGVIGDYEPNNSYEDAESIYVPCMVKGEIDQSDKDDIYKIEVDRGQSLYILAEPDDNLGINLYLYKQVGEGGSATQEQVAADRSPTVGVSEGVPRSINYTANSAQDVFIMYAWVGLHAGEGGYNLTIEVNEQDDAGSDTDAGDTYETATNITPGTYNGFVANADDEDVYGITMKKGDSIYVDVQPEAALSVNLHLIRESDNDGIPVFTEVTRDKRSGDEGRGEHRHVEYVLNSEEAETKMYIKVYRDQDFGEYDLKVAVEHQNDAGSGTDAGDTEATAFKITDSAEYLGYMKGLDKADFYGFDLGDREQLYVNVTPENDLTISISLTLDGTLSSSDMAKNPEHETGDVRSVQVVLPRGPGADAVLKVEVAHGDGNYTMDVSIVPKPLDDEAPEVQLVDPAPGSKLKKKEWSYVGTATDYNNVTKIEVSFDQVEWINTTLTGSDGNYNWNVTVRAKRWGNNTLYIRATDDQGNQDTTGFYIKFVEPEEKGFIPGFGAVSLLAALMVISLMAAILRKGR